VGGSGNLALVMCTTPGCFYTAHVLCIQDCTVDTAPAHVLCIRCAHDEHIVRERCTCAWAGEYFHGPNGQPVAGATNFSVSNIIQS